MAKRTKKNPDEMTDIELIQQMADEISDSVILDKTSVVRQGFVDSTSLALNRIISGEYLTGGVPLGRITQVIGPHSSAKTVIASHILQGAQRDGGIAILIDSENAYSADFAEALGLDPKRLLLMPGDTLEKCFSNMIKAIEIGKKLAPGKKMCIVYDSIAASPSAKELEEALTYSERKPEMGLRGRICSQELRTINGLIAKHNVAVVIINQIRSKIGVMFGNPETGAGGGQSLDYYCSVILDTRSPASKKLADSRKRQIGIGLNVRTTKNKVTAPGLKAEDIKLIWDAGIDPTSGLKKLLVDDDLAVKDGSYYKSVHPETGEEVKWQEKTIAKSLLKAPWILGKHKRWNEKSQTVEEYWPTTEQVERFLISNRLPIDIGSESELIEENENENAEQESNDE